MKTMFVNQEIRTILKLSQLQKGIKALTCRQLLLCVCVRTHVCMCVLWLLSERKTTVVFSFMPAQHQEHLVRGGRGDKHILRGSNQII